MKWFRVATQGATTDGRKISREWIEQMAKNFNPQVYGARVWLEHLRGLFHDGPLAALGDVTAVKAEEVEDGKMALFAQIDPTDRLKEINKERQKVYTSVEVDPEFADTGEAYLVGLAVTDSPASLGTEMLQFSAQQGKASPLAGRKQSEHNLFTAAIETEMDFSDTSADDDKGLENKEGKDSPSLMDSIKALFKRYKTSNTAEFADFRKDLEQTLELFVKQHSDLEKSLQGFVSADASEQLNQAYKELKEQFDKLYKRLDETPDTPPRHNATGTNGGAALTDC